MKTIKDLTELAELKLAPDTKIIDETIVYSPGGRIELNYINPDKLKQSAIEDIKGLQKYHSLITKGRNVGYSIFNEEKRNNSNAIISYIKMKFNITEDDLK